MSLLSTDVSTAQYLLSSIYGISNVLYSIYVKKNLQYLRNNEEKLSNVLSKFYDSVKRE
jgi:hypothetical protein